MAEAKTATVRITDDTHRGNVRGSHNGVRFSVPVDQDVVVSEGTLSALTDSGINMSIVKPLGGAADEGSSAASTVGKTAIRLEVPNADALRTDEDGKPAAPHELSQITDKEATDSQARQSANVTAASKKAAAGGLTTTDRGLPTDTSSAKSAKAAKKPAK